MSNRFPADSLVEFAVALCTRSGMDGAAARDVANILVEGDLLGHDTHGLQLLKPYLDALGSQAMLGSGELDEIASRPAVASWDGKYLPGPYLVLRAIDTAINMAQQYGTGCIAIRRSSHIGALAAYLEKPARAGFLIQIVCSDPAVVLVAPFGGSEPLFTPNPMAWGIPTSTDPVMIDISASTTTGGMSGRLHAAGQKGEHEWWLDSNGQTMLQWSIRSRLAVCRRWVEWMPAIKDMVLPCSSKPCHLLWQGTGVQMVRTPGVPACMFRLLISVHSVMRVPSVHKQIIW